MRDGRQAPKPHRDRVADTSAKAVDEAANHQHAQSIGSLKRKDQMSVLDFIPAKLVL